MNAMVEAVDVYILDSINPRLISMNIYYIT